MMLLLSQVFELPMGSDVVPTFAIVVSTGTPPQPDLPSIGSRVGIRLTQCV
jgi:hypothetical protein